MSKWNYYTNLSLVYNSTQVKNSSFNGEHESKWHEVITDIIFALEIALVVAGAIGSFVVLLDFFKRRKHDKKPSKTLLFHLCLADFLAILTTAVSCLFKNIRLKGTCPLSFACFVLTRYASIFMMVIPSFERYKSITKPFERKMKNSEVLRYIVVSWGATLVISLPQFITSPKLGPRGCLSGHFDQIRRTVYFFWLFLSQYVIPLLVVAVLNIRTFRYMKKNTLNCSKRDSHGETIMNRNGGHCMKNSKVFRTLMYMILNFALCMIPQHIMIIYNEFHPTQISDNLEVTGILVQVTFFDTVLVNAVTNTFLYGAVNRKFKLIAFWRYFRCGTAQIKRENETASQARHFKGLSANSPTLNALTIRLQENKQEYENNAFVHVEGCNHSLSTDPSETAVSNDRLESREDTYL